MSAVVTSILSTSESIVSVNSISVPASVDVSVDVSVEVSVEVSVDVSVDV